MAHRSLDQWFGGVAALLDDGKDVTLRELTEQVHRTRGELLGAVLKAAVERNTYQRAETHFESLTGVNVSEHFLHDTVQEVGESASLERVIPSSEEIRARIEQARAGRPQRPVLVVSADGAFAPIRAKARRDEKRGKGWWREVKGVRLYLIAPRKRIIPVASWHQIADDQEIANDVVKIAAQVPREEVRVGLVGDGADWVWNALRPAFPDAQEVLDHYHCVEHLRDVAQAQFDDELDARQWIEATLAQLHHGEVDEAIDDLLDLEPSTKKAEEMISNLIAYLVNHRDRLDYGRAKRRGMPRGSGGMESANKFISHTRLKRSGAWWLEGNSNAMLRIRCAIYNGTFDSVFRAHMEGQQAARRRPKPVSD